MTKAVGKTSSVRQACREPTSSAQTSGTSHCVRWVSCTVQHHSGRHSDVRKAAARGQQGSGDFLNISVTAFVAECIVLAPTDLHKLIMRNEVHHGQTI